MKHPHIPTKDAGSGDGPSSSRPRRREFSPAEVEFLREMFFSGATWPVIASALGRTAQSVRQKCYAIGLRRFRMNEVKVEKFAKSTLQNRRYQRKYPEKRRAHKAVEWALASKTIHKKPCENCGADDVHAHHDDYSRPLDVRWLCPLCHKAEHAA